MRSKLIFGLALCVVLGAFAVMTPRASAYDPRSLGGPAGASPAASPFNRPATAYRVAPVYPNPYAQAYYRNLYLQRAYANQLHLQYLLSVGGGGCVCGGNGGGN
jgi:hypothetical protein